MKHRIRTIFAITIGLLVLAGCASKNTDSDLFPANKSNRAISLEDFDTSYELCKHVLVNYYSAAVSNKELDLSKCFAYKNLYKYRQETLKKSKYDNTFKSHTIKTSITNIKWHDNYVDFKIATIVTLTDKDNNDFSFADNNQLLVINNNGTLAIADWTISGMGRTGSIDTEMGLSQEKLNINKWNNNAWSQTIIRKAKK